LVAQGLSNKQIARQMALSEGTVRNYLSTAFAKLGVENRVEAATRWLGLEPLPGSRSDGQWGPGTSSSS
jgi:DNA-binding NarL/FixJ family response regulator